MSNSVSVKSRSASQMQSILPFVISTGAFPSLRGKERILKRPGVSRRLHRRPNHSGLASAGFTAAELVSQRSPSANRVRASAILASILLIAALIPAFGQTATFTLSPSPSSIAVEPGGKPSSNIAVDSTSNSSVDVTLSCSVAPVEPNGTPTCAISPQPQPVVTPAVATLNITTAGNTPATTYTVTVTGVDNSTTPPTMQTATVELSVLAVVADYTLSVTTPVTPSSVHAGSGATAVITVTSLNGYSGAVTLSCSAVTPAVEFGPTCSFPSAVMVPSNGTQTGTLTITTYGTTTTTPTTAIFRSRIFYAFFLPLPGVAIVALRRNRRTSLALFLLCSLALAVLFLPSCSSSRNSTTTTSNTGITPNNSYTFTITGADTNSLAPSNGTQSVSLTVD